MTESPRLPSPSPEWALLRRCHSPALDAGACIRIQQLAAQPLNWPAAVALADAHGVGGLLHLALTTAAPHAVPRAIGDLLARNFYESKTRAFRLAGQLADVTNALSHEGVEAIAVKGPLLSVQAYGQLGARSFNDLDVLVGRHQLNASRRALEAAGYAVDPVHRRFLEGPYPRAEYHYGFMSTAPGDGRALVEVHAEPFMWYLGIEWAWQDLRAHSVPLTLCGHPVRGLGSTDAMLFLAVHSAADGWSRFEHVTAFLGMARQPNLDWPAALEKAQALGVARMLKVAIVLTDALTGGDVGLAAEAARVDPATARLALALAARLMRRRSRAWSAVGRLGVHLAVHDSLWRRSQYVWRSLATQAVGLASLGT